MGMACQQLELGLNDSAEGVGNKPAYLACKKLPQVEATPDGLDQHAPGAKLDAGKVMPSLILGDMSRALLAVSEVATFGANKYTKGGWLHVTNGQERYRDAADRHRLKQGFESYDPDSELLHLAHEAWNVLALLQLKLMET